ncbi:MAG TPA: condensation domain-containing protein, partial [Thermoanaerobaculia bacterium]
VRLVKGADYAALGGEEVFLQLAPLPFDASTLEVWGALLNGARLELLPPGTPSLAELGREVERSRVTTLWLTAGLFHQMVEEELPRLAGVRQLLAGGDVLSPARVARVRAALGPGRVLVNGYGPTEGTTFTCCHRMGPAAAGEGAGERAPVPIGRPISNTRAYLVEAAPGRGLHPAPTGVPGELWLGGDGVARGYLARPALTAAAFVPDPFAGGEAGGRLYRTGDLARWLPDGRIEFLGRIDRQVKLRGFRIELGEIEAALAAHPAVAEAAVDVRGAEADEKRLAAWVVPAPGAPEGTALGAELRRHLAERLPDYMVPRAFAVLDALPLGPTGKVDRRALPEPAAAAPGAATEGAAGPGTPLEETLRGVWEDLLGVARVGLRDDFFELGGHSLLATRLVSRVRDLLGAEVPLRRLFEAPTVAGLAAAVAEALAGERGAPAPPPVEAIAEPELRARPPLSFAQERLWFLDRLAPGGAGYTVSVPLELRGELDPRALARSLAALAARHEVLRTRYPEEDGRPYQRVEAPPPPALPVADLSRLRPERREAEAARLRARESRRPFDLRRGPVIRRALVRLGRVGHHLLLNLHHIAFDGWSLGILLEELGVLYRGFAAGADDPAAGLPPLPVRYADYAVWQRRWLAGEVLDAHLAWWRERLAGPLPRLELPADRPRPPVESPRGAVVSRALPRDLERRLAAVGRSSGASLYMVLLAAFDALLHRYTGETDLPVGTPEANRGRAEVEGLIGFFTNTLVVRADLSGDPPFREALARVREAALGAFTHAELPFEALVEALDPERSLAATPLFQALMAFLTGPEAERRRRWGDLEVRRLSSHNAAAKFDLSLYVEAGAGGLRAAVEYRTDLFDRTTAERLLGHYDRLLAAVAEAPGTRLSELPLLTPAERHQVAVAWAEPPGVVAPPACLHELVR